MEILNKSILRILMAPHINEERWTVIKLKIGTIKKHRLFSLNNCHSTEQKNNKMYSPFFIFLLLREFAKA